MNSSPHHVRILLLLALAIFVASTAFAQAGSVIHCDSPGSHADNGAEPAEQPHMNGDGSIHGQTGDSGSNGMSGIYTVTCWPAFSNNFVNKPARCTAVGHCNDGSEVRCTTNMGGGHAQVTPRVVTDQNGGERIEVEVMCGVSSGSGAINVTDQKSCLNT